MPATPHAAGDGTAAVYPASIAMKLPDCMLAVAATIQPDPASQNPLNPNGQDQLMRVSSYGQGVRIAAPVRATRSTYNFLLCR